MHWRISKSLQRGVVNGNSSRQTGVINAYNSNRYGAPHPPALSSATVCFGLSAFARGFAGNTTTPTRRTPIPGNHHSSWSNQIAGATIKRYASNTIYANLISNEPEHRNLHHYQYVFAPASSGFVQRSCRLLVENISLTFPLFPSTLYLHPSAALPILSSSVYLAARELRRRKRMHSPVSFQFCSSRQICGRVTGLRICLP
jgi:hypothetical protein